MDSRPHLAESHESNAAVDAGTPAERVSVGQAWSVEASGLDPERLSGERGRRALGALFDDLIEALDLHPVAAPVWHVFPGPHAGVTGIVALSESHLACHTFPEHGGVTLDLYTCRARRAPDWSGVVAAHFGLAGDPPSVAVRVRRRVLDKARRHESAPGDGVG